MKIFLILLFAQVTTTHASPLDEAKAVLLKKVLRPAAYASLLAKAEEKGLSATLFWENYRDSLVLDPQLARISDLGPSDFANALEQINAESRTAFPTSDMDETWFANWKQETANLPADESLMSSDGQSNPGAPLSQQSWNLEIQSVQYLLLEEGIYSKNAQGDYYCVADIPAPTRKYCRGLGRVGKFDPVGYPIRNSAREFFLDRAHPLLVNLSQPINTEGDFRLVIQLLAQTDIGQAVILSLMGIESSRQVANEPIALFHHPKFGVQIEPRKTLDTDPRLTNNLHQGPRVTISERRKLNRQIASRIQFKRGEELGLLAIDLLYAAVVDGPLGIETLARGFFVGLNREHDFDAQIVGLRSELKNTEDPVAQEALRNKIGHLENRQMKFFRDRYRYLFNEAHGIGGRFYEQLVAREGYWDEHSAAVAYYRSREALGQIHGVAQPTDSKRIVNAYGGCAAWFGIYGATETTEPQSAPPQSTTP